MEKAKQHLLNQGAVTIKLEAQPDASHFYRNLGFLREYDSLRFEGFCRRPPLHENPDVKPMKKEMLGDVAEFDAQYFGANRLKVLDDLQQACPRLCLVLYTKSKINGYIMCRASDARYNVGPWVCSPENAQGATDLLIACLQRISPEAPVHVRVPAPNEDAIRILNELGFRQYSKTIRMRFGEKLKNERIKGIFAIGGAMKG